MVVECAQPLTRLILPNGWINYSTSPVSCTVSLFWNHGIFGNDRGNSWESHHTWNKTTLPFGGSVRQHLGVATLADRRLPFGTRAELISRGAKQQNCLFSLPVKISLNRVPFENMRTSTRSPTASDERP